MIDSIILNGRGMYYVTMKHERDMATLKLILWSIWGWFVGIFIPVQPLLVVTCVLTLCNLASGIGRCLMTGEPILGKKILRTPVKICLYVVGVGTMQLLNVYILQGYANLLPFPFIVAALIALSESKSVLENITKATGVKLFDKIKEYLPDIIQTRKKPPPMG